MTVYGLQADIDANKDKNVNLYIPGKTQLNDGDIFLGGPGTGVTDEMLGKGIRRIYGKTAQDTANVFANYKPQRQNPPQGQVEQMYGIPAGAKITLAMRDYLTKQNQNERDYNAQQDQFNRNFNAQQQQQGWENNYNVGQLMGMYNNSPTLAKQSQAIQQAQFDKDYELQLQQLAADTAYKNAALARSGGSGGGGGGNGSYRPTAAEINAQRNDLIGLVTSGIYDKVYGQNNSNQGALKTLTSNKGAILSDLSKAGMSAKDALTYYQSMYDDLGGK